MAAYVSEGLRVIVLVGKVFAIDNALVSCFLSVDRFFMIGLLFQ